MKESKEPKTSCRIISVQSLQSSFYHSTCLLSSISFGDKSNCKNPLDITCFTQLFVIFVFRAVSFSTEIYKQISGEEAKEDKPAKSPVQDLKSVQMIKANPKRKT